MKKSNYDVGRIARNIIDAERNGHNAYREIILATLKPKDRARVLRALIKL